MPRERLDLILVARGYCDSREKARRAVMAGEVRVDGQVVDKPGTRVSTELPIEVEAPPKYVGRGGFKLEAALDHFGVDPSGLVCLDIGASTGGFTDCLLQRGAAKVWAIDVGHGQIDWKIRSDPRVEVREGLNARHLAAGDITDPIGVCVIDVSFISLTLILPPAEAALTKGGVILALIKPQFELERGDVAKGGVVRDPLLHERAIEKIRAFAGASMRLEWAGCIPSPITGAEGNREFLACLR